MITPRLEQRRAQLEKALTRLDEALAQPAGHYGRVDLCIQRFEFSIELFWKTLKLVLQEKKLIAHTPRDVIAEAFRAHLIGDETTWLAMLDDRNLAAHTYNEELANAIAARLPGYLAVMQTSYAGLPR